jgi:hypothetical protein
MLPMTEASAEVNNAEAVCPLHHTPYFLVSNPYRNEIWPDAYKDTRRTLGPSCSQLAAVMATPDLYPVTDLPRQQKIDLI